MPDITLVNVLFDGSFDGFCSIIHAHFYDKVAADYINEQSSFQETLGGSYKFITTDYEKSEKVFNAICEKISPEAASTVYKAFLSDGKERFINIYRYILLGFKKGAEVDRYMKYDYVTYVQKAARYVGGEAHLLTGFCRFTETVSGVLYAPVGPVNNVLAILAGHFSQRLMNEQWIIHDTKRHIAAVYDGNEFIISEVPDSVKVFSSSSEAEYRELWRSFFNTIAIENRKNKNLQRNNLPLRYRKHMTEFILV